MTALKERTPLTQQHVEEKQRRSGNQLSVQFITGASAAALLITSQGRVGVKQLVRRRDARSLGLHDAERRLVTAEAEKH